VAAFTPDSLNFLLSRKAGVDPNTFPWFAGPVVLFPFPPDDQSQLSFFLGVFEESFFFLLFRIMAVGFPEMTVGLSPDDMVFPTFLVMASGEHVFPVAFSNLLLLPPPMMGESLHRRLAFLV